MRPDVCGVFHDYPSSLPAGEKELDAMLLYSDILISRLMLCGHNVVRVALTITVRQAAVAAQRTMTFQYGRPLERHS